MASIALYLKFRLYLANLGVGDILNHLPQLTGEHVLKLLVFIAGLIVERFCYQGDLLVRGQCLQMGVLLLLRRRTDR